MRVWLWSSQGGNRCIGGSGSKAWGALDCGPEPAKPLKQCFLQLLRSIFGERKDPTKKLDLVATHPLRKEDGLTRWITKEWIPFYHRCRHSINDTGRNDEEKRCIKSSVSFQAKICLPKDVINNFQKELYKKYSGKAIARFSSSVATVIACVLPTVAITLLTTAHGNKQRLLYIGGFTALFATGLMFFTDADTPRTHIFTATAA